MTWRPASEHEHELIGVAYLIGARDAMLHIAALEERLRDVGRCAEFQKHLITYANWFDEDVDEIQGGGASDGIDRPFLRKKVSDTFELQWDGKPKEAAHD